MQQRQIKKEIDLVNYQQLEEAQSQSNVENQNGSVVPKSQAESSLLFQFESPKNNNLQPPPIEDKAKQHKLSSKETVQAKGNSGANPLTYQIELASERSEQEKQENSPPAQKKEANPNPQKLSNNENSVDKKNEKQKGQTKEEVKQDRMKRRKNKSGFKDIFNGSQPNIDSAGLKQEASKTKQPKNIEYGKSQQHSQSQNQRTDIPLKEQPLTVNQRLEALRQEKAPQPKQIKQLPPLKKQKTKKQQQDPSLIFYNDSSIVALDKFAQGKHKNQGSSASQSYQAAVFNRFAFKPVSQGKDLNFIFQREKNCMKNYYHPQYSLVFNLNKLVFSARKQWGNINSHYNISCQQKNYSKQGKYYAGCLKGNFTGTQFNLYSHHEKTSELVATVVYKAELNCIEASYRKIQIYVKNEDYAYNELAGYVQGEEKGLQQLYEVQDNARAKKIIKLINKQPEWSYSLNAFTMNFKGKLKMASVKNMILVEQANKHQNALMLCKESQNEFYLEIGSPLTPFMAIGIVLTSFDFKLFCQ